MRRYARWLLLVALVPLAAGAVMLRHRHRVGEETRFRETMKASGVLAITSPMGEQNIPVEIDAVETRSVKVTEALDNGEYWLESRSIAIQARVTTQGQTTRQDTPGQNFRFRVNELGDVLETEHTGATGGGDMTVSLKLNSLLKASRMTGFPVDDIEVGGTWSKEIPLGDGQTASVNSTLERVEEVDGRQQAVIVSRYDVPIPASDGTLSMGGMQIPVRIEGRSTGETTATWDVAGERSVGSVGKGQINIKLYLMGLTTDPAIGRFNVDMSIAPIEE